MASLATKSGVHQVQWTATSGKRETIYLGKTPKRWAEEFRRRLERLVDAKAFGEPLDRATARWLAELNPKWRAKLADKGLSDPLPVSTIGELLQHQRAAAVSRGVVESTLTKYDDIKANLCEFFDADRPLLAVSENDAEEFRNWLRKCGSRPDGGPLAETTVTNRCKHAKSMFKVAVRKHWIHENPFEAMVGWEDANPDRRYFVERETVDRLFAVSRPGALRLGLAMARYLGVRVASELRPLKWEWVDWDQQMITVLDWKRKRYPSKRYRHVPIFPELLPYLEEAWEAAPEGAEFIFSEHDRKITNAAWYNRLEKLCLRAKVHTWERLWQNLRSTRETELLDQYPIHVVTSWIGNSPKVAIRNYGQVTKEHLARATGRPLALPAEDPPSAGDPPADSARLQNRGS
ncbi:MAG: phage integrase SAM-like domain-containing protein [Planctomycetota bacterium]